VNNGKSFDFKSFSAANAGQVSSFDYLHAIYKEHELATDFLVCFSKLFWPDFNVVDNLIFISELFDSERYQDLLKNGQNATQAQFWMNLLEITGMFDELPTNEAILFSETLSACWNSKLKAEFGNQSVTARAIHDDETGEIFVTICKPDF
jgi:hypothetical protein